MTDGSCGTTSQSIKVQWGQQSQMVLQFTVNDTVQQFMLSEVYLLINASDVAADAKGKVVFDLGSLFFSGWLVGEDF